MSFPSPQKRTGTLHMASGNREPRPGKGVNPLAGSGNFPTSTHTPRIASRGNANQKSARAPERTQSERGYVRNQRAARGPITDTSAGRVRQSKER